MTYWYMQLQTDNQDLDKEFLEKTNFIGLNKAQATESQIKQFNNEMDIGDVVLIKRGSKPIALVEVIGNAESTDLPCFENRRKIKILDIIKTDKNDFPQTRSTLQKSVNRYTPTYQYINDLYNQITNPNLNNKGVKIRSIYIESYKMFNNFHINFLDKNDKITPIIVIAGINGSGKTSLLEYIKNFETSPKFDCEDYIDIYLNGSNTRIKKNSKYKSTTGIKEFKNSIVYLAVNFNEIDELKEKIQEYINELMFERDYKASEAYNELQDNINEIFKEINLEIKFSGLNKNKQIFFTNSSGKKFSIAELSTGEMTLLTKVLYLYLSEITNQVILIDEPEMSLHPNWQNSILELYEIFAQKNNNQIIIATHSPHIISGAKSNYIRILELSNSKINVIDDYNQSYGLEVSRILTDIMGVNALRTPSVENKINQIKKSIIDNDHLVFDKLIKELEDDISDKDTDIKMLKLEMSMRRNSV